MAHNCLWWNFCTSSLFFSAIVVVVCHFRIPQFEKMHFRHCWGRGVTIQKVHTGRLHIRMNYYMVLMGVFNAADAHFLFVPSLLSEFISEQPAAKLETRPKNNVPSNFFLVFFSVFFLFFCGKTNGIFHYLWRERAAAAAEGKSIPPLNFHCIPIQKRDFVTSTCQWIFEWFVLLAILGWSYCWQSHQ